MFWHRDPAHKVKQAIKPILPKLWRYCLLLTANPDRAEDLLQSACLRAIEKADLYKPDVPIDRWLFRVTKNIWFNELRADAVRLGGGLHSIEDVELFDLGETPESSTINKDIILSVLSLPEAQRIVVSLVYIEGYSYSEAADTLDIPIGTVMSRLSAARSKLAARLRPFQRGVL